MTSAVAGSLIASACGRARPTPAASTTTHPCTAWSSEWSDRRPAAERRPRRAASASYGLGRQLPALMLRWGRPADASGQTGGDHEQRGQEEPAGHTDLKYDDRHQQRSGDALDG